ncbi:MAG: nucleotidyltransferase domain-containing protein [Planctomycetota bacterium]|jgi:predicted nucleotidyltransferase
MVEPAIELVVRRYLRAARDEGIHVTRAVVFGSYARGDADEWSDIDLVVIAPEFDGPPDAGLVDRLWTLRAHTDSRIEPFACGEREWESDGSRPVIEIARREGVVIAA